MVITTWHSLCTTTCGCLPNSGAPVSTLETQQHFMNHNSQGEGKFGGSSPSLTSSHKGHSQMQSPLPRQGLHSLTAPPQILLKPQSNILIAPGGIHPVGDNHTQGRPTQQKWGWREEESAAWLEDTEASFQDCHFTRILNEGISLSVRVKQGNTTAPLTTSWLTLPPRDTPYRTVSQLRHQDTLWPRCTAMHCYIQVLPLAFANLGFRDGRDHGLEKAVHDVKVQGEQGERMNESMREKLEKIQVRAEQGKNCLAWFHLIHGRCWMRWHYSGQTARSQYSATTLHAPRGHFYFPIQSLLVVSQEQLKKHKQSFNSLLPEGLSSESGLVLITHSYEAAT